MLPFGEIKAKKKSLRATNLELFGRDNSVSADDKKIYLRDSDNLYPLRMEKIIHNSPTGRRASNMMAKYISGDGVTDNIVVNARGETINDIADNAAAEIAMHYGVFFHIFWKFRQSSQLQLERYNLRVLDSVLMARSKEDDDEFPGKFYQLVQEEGKSIFQKSENKATKWFYPYTEDPTIVKAQMLNDCRLKGIINPTPKDLVENYRGQVYYLNLTPKYPYALPPWDSVYNDMDTEYRISVYNNSQARTGWLGKVIVKKFQDDEAEPGDVDEFNKVLKDNLGSDNAADVMVVDVPLGSADDIDKVFKIDLIKAQFDDKLFESTEKSLRQKITGAFNNIPEALVFSGSGALFGTSADTYSEMKRFYWEQNETERFKLETVMSKLLGRQISFIPIKGVENGVPALQ
ncbi:hypothetical protein SAMN05443429_11224 [Cruoricaptor ignavus]|uniref:Phage portal protein n=1 Tax=Cruoricaptor ignavus TaxID=1118202 RepID=A0A1M6HDN0_9FLAO|nr:hypothetical protein [Cruoricaptor ignavus]SHJ20226.1 hypothetical protein SAMN05443429_11224 [Cruoricaptor ignavus]